MDAGINLEKHVAGLSMGLLTKLDPATQEIVDYRILTDILVRSCGARFTLSCGGYTVI